MPLVPRAGQCFFMMKKHLKPRKPPPPMAHPPSLPRVWLPNFDLASPHHSITFRSPTTDTYPTTISLFTFVFSSFIVYLLSPNLPSRSFLFFKPETYFFNIGFPHFLFPVLQHGATLSFLHPAVSAPAFCPSLPIAHPASSSYVHCR